jgi:hypothetical protein
MYIITTPFRAVIAGVSGSGKTVFTFKLLENIHMMQPKPTKIFYFYGIYQPLFDKYREICTFVEGEPTLEKMGDEANGALVICDDLMDQITDSSLGMFIKNSHHLNMSFIYLVQNLYFQNKYMRTITLNSDIVVCFKCPRDRRSIYYISQQAYPRNASFLIDAFADATVTPHSYLLLNFKQDTPEALRVCTNIFDHSPTFYAPIDADLTL